jgi:alkylated DNA repair protein alkB family protein 1
LETHAVHPNENNLDTHYKIPEEGLWPTWKAFNHEQLSNPHAIEPVIATKTPTIPSAESSSKRTPIDNVPASVANFEDLQAVAKPAAPPSSSLIPLPLSSIIHKLRWSNLGHFYHWGTKSYQFDRQQVPMPSDIKTVCQRVVRAVPWQDIWRDGVDVAAGEWELPNPDYSQWHETYSQWQYDVAQILVF